MEFVHSISKCAHAHSPEYAHVPCSELCTEIKKDVRRASLISRNITKSSPRKYTVTRTENGKRANGIARFNQQSNYCSEPEILTENAVQRAFKPVPSNALPVRDTLASKLRQEKTNNILTSNIVKGSEIFPQVIENKNRKSTFPLGIMQLKRKLESRIDKPFPDSKHVLKVSLMNVNNTKSYVLKDNRSQFSGPQKNKLSNIESKVITSKPTRLSAVIESPSLVQKRNIRTFIENKTASLSMSRTHNQKLTCNRNVSLSTPENKKSSYKLQTKQVRTNLRPLETQTGKGGNSFMKCRLVSSRLQSIPEKLRTCGNATTKNSSTVIVGEVNKKCENCIPPSKPKNLPILSRSTNKNRKLTSLDSPRSKTTFKAPPAHKCIEKWLMERGKSPHNYRHLQCFGVFKDNFIFPVNYQVERKYRINMPVLKENDNPVAISFQSLEESSDFDICSSTLASLTKFQRETPLVEETKWLNNKYQTKSNTLYRPIKLNYNFSHQLRDLYKCISKSSENSNVDFLYLRDKGHIANLTISSLLGLSKLQLANPISEKIKYIIEKFQVLFDTPNFMKDHASCFLAHHDLDTSVPIVSKDLKVISSVNESNYSDIENTTPSDLSNARLKIVCVEENKYRNNTRGDLFQASPSPKIINSRDHHGEFVDFSRALPAVKELSQYWLYMAAVHVVREDFISAIECYEQAIIKGADATDVEDRLEELRKKISTLKTQVSEPDYSNKNEYDGIT